MTPTFQVEVEGQRDITAAILDRLLSLRVNDEEGYESDSVEIILDDRGGLIEPPRRGVILKVSMGYSSGGRAAGLKADSALVLMGRFTVDEVWFSEPPATLLINAEAADMRETLKQSKTRAWHMVTIGSLVATVAGDHGLEARVSGALSGIELPHVDQTEESDLNLLTRLGEQYDAAFKVGNGRLVFAKRGEGQSATSGPVEAVAIAREQVSQYRATLTDRDRYRSVRAYWYDVAMGSRQEVLEGDGEPVYALRDNYIDEATARAAAISELDSLMRDTDKLSLTLKVGLPTLSAGVPLTLSGFREGVKGKWIANRVTHQIDGNGYSTTLEGKKPTTE